MPHFLDQKSELLPLAFPSWEGLGVGSSCLFPTTATKSTND
ncbi:hypothetical protein [Moorena sp. SIO4E2]|nr:hypothetical protein [Moorena sp. SIO4E2]